MVARTLITTADEKTWPKIEGKPVLFLGEWCKRFSRKEKWDKLNSKVVPYRWDDRQIFYSDNQYLEELYEKILSELSCKLNYIHSVDHSLTYWRILIGPWLGNFIHILFERWTMLDKSIESFESLKCTIIERDPLSVIPNHTSHFISLIIDDDWNEAIYGQLLEKYFSKLIKIKKIKLHPSVKNPNSVPKKSLNIRLKSQIKKLILNAYLLLPNKNLYFFISSYLPLNFESLLQLRLGQFPRIWRSKEPPLATPNLKKRLWRIDSNDINDRSFEAIARQFIPLHIPTSYLEGYDGLMKIVNQLPWPKKPKSIFTSNSYYADDVFKAWSAEKVEINIPLIIGQHGGNYGMNAFSFDECHQLKIASHFFSWGWSDTSRPKIIPIGNLKAMGKKKLSYNPSGGALMIETIVPRFSYLLSAIPISRQWLDYFSDQKAFLRTLSKDLREQVLLRLFKEDYGWDQFERWQAYMPEVKVDLGNQDISKLIKNNRLCIITYNATSFLEALHWNIPIIAFWNQEHWELNNEVMPYFELLQSVGILHKNPKSAAKHMTKVWDDVPSWWESSEVERAKLEFCKQFSHTLDNPIANLKSLFKGVYRNYD